jgi:hypothetical protein
MYTITIAAMKALKYLSLLAGLVILAGAGYLGLFLNQVAPLALMQRAVIEGSPCLTGMRIYA